MYEIDLKIGKAQANAKAESESSMKMAKPSISNTGPKVGNQNFTEQHYIITLLADKRCQA